MPRPPESFETARLFVRKPRVEDAPAIFEAYAQDAEVTRYLVWKPYTEIAPLEAYLRRCLDDWEVGKDLRYELCLRGTDTPVGALSVRLECFSANYGYALARRHWGQGLVAEALKHLVDWALDQPEIYRAWAYCDLENPASARVMEKAGMTREGILRRWCVCPTIGPEPRDCFVYAKVK